MVAVVGVASTAAGKVAATSPIGDETTIGMRGIRSSQVGMEGRGMAVAVGSNSSSSKDAVLRIVEATSWARLKAINRH